MAQDRPDDLALWVRTTLLPAWMERIYHPERPGYIEMVDPDGADSQVGRRTTLVTARLIYVFSHAHLIGVDGALEAARHGLAFLLGPCRRPEGGFVHACTSEGAVLDGRADLYDLAFVLFALGWYARASGEAEPLNEARRLMAFIETRLAHPAGGFMEDTLGTLPRRQNPHMHLLEACHAVAETSGDSCWLAQADSLVTLMRERMLDAKTGSLGEFFGEDWGAWDGPRGLIREPGHHYEWTWLLYHHERLTHSASARVTARQVYGFADRFQRGKNGPVVNEIDPDGVVLDGAALLWPQTEYLKALVARIEFEGDEIAAARLEPHLRLMFDCFIDRETGLWVNRIDPSGEPVLAAIPVRVLYHLLLACAEIVRVKPRTRLPGA